MKKCFVFAIGGTGSRVLRSMMFLLAGGVLERMAGGQWEIVPVVIDLDATNKNLDKSLEVLNTYRDIQSEIGVAASDGKLFKTKVKRLKDHRSQAQSADFTLPIHLGKSKSLKDFIDYDGLARTDAFKPTEALVELLFPEHYLDMDLQVGTKGAPGVGTIVFEQLGGSSPNGGNAGFTNRDFSAFINAYQAGDRIFVVGSLFGGTGSAGIPWLIKTIRHRMNSGGIGGAPIGMLGVLPYFKLSEPEADQSEIDSKTFVARTKAALGYYHDHLDGVNSAYYIGMNAFDTQYANHEGGELQYNQAHLVELIGANSIFHFLSQPASALSSAERGQTLRYGLFQEDWSEAAFDLTSFSRVNSADYEAMALGLTQLFYTYLIFEKGFPQLNRWRWADQANISADKIKNSIGVYERIKGFLGDYHLWLKELAGFIPGQVNALKFEPFDLALAEKVDLNTSLLNMIRNMEMSPQTLSTNFWIFRRSITYNMPFGDLMLQVENSVGDVQVPDTAHEALRLLEMIHLGTERILMQYKSSILSSS
ncbi:MAG: hypothetical protein AAF998_02130 [Bacteroidota bacterium]